MPQWSWPSYSPQQPFYKAPWKKGVGKAEGQQSKGASKGQHKGKQKQEQQDWNGGKGADHSRFPKYDQVRAPPHAIVEVATTSAATTADDLLVKELQRCVNLARKAEQKVSGLQKQISTKQQQWESFQTEIKQSFLKEQSRFQQDLQRLQAELSAAEASQAEARAVVRTAARGESITSPQEEIDREHMWLQRVQSWEQEGSSREELPSDAVLRRALEAATSRPPMGHTEFLTPARPTRTGICTPSAARSHGGGSMSEGSGQQMEQSEHAKTEGTLERRPGDASVVYFGGLPSPPVTADPYSTPPPTIPVPKVAAVPRKPHSHQRAWEAQNSYAYAQPGRFTGRQTGGQAQDSGEQPHRFGGGSAGRCAPSASDGSEPCDLRRRGPASGRRGECCIRLGDVVQSTCWSRTRCRGGAPSNGVGPLGSSLWQRGGPLFGALGSSNSGHVPTEPKQVLTFICRIAAAGGRRRYWLAVSLCLDGAFSLEALSPGSGKLIVSIRQLVCSLDFLDLSVFEFSLPTFSGRPILCAGDIPGDLRGISLQWFGVISPLLSGGLLSTQRGYFLVSRAGCSGSLVLLLCTSFWSLVMDTRPFMTCLEIM